jgi:tRNA(fMet)-specific endonuclease VapC
LFRNGRNQAIRIPREFELPGDEAIIRKEGARLVNRAGSAENTDRTPRFMGTDRGRFRTDRRSAAGRRRVLMARLLLDTNILSDAVKNPTGRVANRMRRLGDGEICTSIIVAAEICFGFAKRESRRLAERVTELFRTLAVAALEVPVDSVYAGLRADLERRGLTVGADDMLIAAHAMALDCTLVTANEREFRRIEGLKIDNWLHQTGTNT